jgi:CTP:molybdopterin cytidylyltransferase MocA
MIAGAVILAAGAGLRMGGIAKALLANRGGNTFLATVIASAREAGAREVIVVVGAPHGDAVAARARELGATVVINPEPERGMASSVAVGFAAIPGTACTAAWLWPVDHPDVSAATLRTLVASLGEHAAARPVVDGQRGHPPLIARALWPQLAACGDVAGGARAVLAEADVIDVAVTDPGCIHDVDRVEDLA